MPVRGSRPPSYSLTYAVGVVALVLALASCRGLETASSPRPTTPAAAPSAGSGGNTPPLQPPPPTSGGSTGTVSKVEHVYISSYDENVLVGYTLDLSTGELTRTKQGTFMVKPRPGMLVADTTTNSLYQVSADFPVTPTINLIKQDPVSGDLAKTNEQVEIKGTRFTLSPDRLTIYVGNNNTTISVFLMGNGNFQPAPGSPYALGRANEYVAVDASNRFVVNAATDGHTGGWELQTYRRNSDGSLVANTRLAMGMPLGGTLVHPIHQLVLITEVSNGQLTSYRIQEDGSLLRAMSVSTPARPTNIYVSPNGKYVYVHHDDQSHLLSGYAITADGGLTPLPGSPYLFTDRPTNVGFSTDGGYLIVPYVEIDSLQVAKVEADGRLTLLPKIYPTARQPNYAVAMR
jgi:6-phosphogluconolactonase (cycloisomerase 2 family)